jgi:hypothetical protein
MEECTDHVAGDDDELRFSEVGRPGDYAKYAVHRRALDDDFHDRLRSTIR